METQKQTKKSPEETKKKFELQNPLKNLCLFSVILLSLFYNEHLKVLLFFS